jgi:hypothetical protein
VQNASPLNVAVKLLHLWSPFLSSSKFGADHIRFETVALQGLTEREEVERRLTTFPLYTSIDLVEGLRIRKVRTVRSTRSAETSADVFGRTDERNGEDLSRTVEAATFPEARFSRILSVLRSWERWKNIAPTTFSHHLQMSSK